MPNSIRRRLTLNFILLALLPLVVTSGIVVWLGFTVQRDHALSLQREKADLAASMVQGYLHSLEADLLLANTTLAAAPPSDLALRADILASIIHVPDSPIEELVLIDPMGMEILRTGVGPDRPLADVAPQPVYLFPKAFEGTWLSPVRFGSQLGSDQGDPHLSISVPLFDTATGELVSIMAADVNLSRLGSLVTELGLRESGVVYILDSYGRVIAHPQPEVVRSGMAFNIPTTPGLTTGLSGNSVMLALSNLDMGGQFFTIVAEQDLPRAMGVSMLMLGALVVVMILSLVAAFALAFMTVRFIVTPLQNLAVTARAVRAGDITRRARVEGKDEIAELAEAFNSMTARLAGTLGGLRAKIDELTTTRNKLSASEQKFRSLFEQAPAGLLLVDSSGRIMDANPHALELFGYSQEEVIGRTIRDLALDEDTPQLSRDVFLDPVRHGAVMEAEVRFHRSGDRVVTCAASASPVDDRTIQIIFRDVSMRKRMEEELLGAKTQAEAANKAKGEFLANMSHEIRTPLSCIIGMSELILDSNLDEEQRESMEMVMDAGVSLLDIINDLLDFSKIEAQKLQFRMTAFSPRKAVEKTLAAFQAQAKRRGLELGLNVDAAVPDKLIGDPGRINQVLRNLVGNALKFTEKGEVIVDVSSRPSGRGGCLLTCTVADTGIGIPENRLSQLFSSFTQVDSSYAKRYQGTGLGLAISKKLVEMMQGRIWVESTLGRGSLFGFTIDLEKPGGADPVEAPGQKPAAPDTGDKGSIRILVVEDNEANSAFLLKYLRKQGFTVEFAANGRLALNYLAAHQVDLILMDIQMPEMDGLEATRRIRAGECGANAPNLPIIAVSAYAMKHERERFLAAGMNDFVAKPVQTHELLQAITKALAAHKKLF